MCGECSFALRCRDETNDRVEPLIHIISRDDENELAPDFFEICEVKVALVYQRSRQLRGADLTAL